MRHFRDTLEWTSGDRHSIHAVEESIEYILYYKRTRTDAGPAHGIGPTVLSERPEQRQ